MTAKKTGTPAPGDRLFFGSYPQSTDRPEPIEWRVLEIKDGKALMISEKLLDARRFDAVSSDWQSSELRAWLNDTFLSTAFSVEEREKLSFILCDKVTCMSINEAEHYFSYDSYCQKGFTVYPDRMAEPTAYAVKNGAQADPDLGTCWWWLCSPAVFCDDVKTVNSYGWINCTMAGVDSVYGGVRPMILVTV